MENNDEVRYNSQSMTVKLLKYLLELYNIPDDALVRFEGKDCANIWYDVYNGLLNFTESRSDDVKYFGKENIAPLYPITDGVFMGGNIKYDSPKASEVREAIDTVGDDFIARTHIIDIEVSTKSNYADAPEYTVNYNLK